MNGDSLQLCAVVDGELVNLGSLHRSEMSTLAVRDIVKRFSDGKWEVLGRPEEKAGTNEILVNVTLV